MESNTSDKTDHKLNEDYPLANRVGVNLLLPESLAKYGEKLPIGWYKNFGIFGVPLCFSGEIVDYVPILLYKSKEDVTGKEDIARKMWDAGQFPTVPGLTFEDLLDIASPARLKERIARDVARFPAGALFLVGIEPGYAGVGDDRTPQEIVNDAKILKEMLDELDKGYRLGLGGMSTAKNRYAKEGYGGVYGIDFFKNILDCCGDFEFDTFVIHPYPDPFFPDAPSFEDSKAQIIEFRQVMAEHGLRERDLLVGEIGVPFPGLKEENKLEFTRRIIEFMLTYTDENIGNPSDGNLLVQRFCWFSLLPPEVQIPGATDNPGLDFNASALLDAQGQLTSLGKVFRETVDQIMHAK